MERAQYTVIIDIVNTGTVKTPLRLKQGDSGIPLYIKVENNGNPYYEESMLPQVYFRRPDRSTVIGTVQAGSDNKYLYVFKGSELAIAGVVMADVKFKHANGRESTSTFAFECVADTIGQNIETSKVMWNDIVEVVEKAEALIPELKKSDEIIARMAEQAEAASTSAEAAAASEAAASASKSTTEENARMATESAKAASDAAETASKASESANASAKEAAESNQNLQEYVESAEENATLAKEYAEQAKESAENLEVIPNLINQASKSWIVPSGELVTVISDIGEPNEEKYPAGEHAGDITFWYLDVTNGKLYQSQIIVVPNGGEYSEWTYVRTCESVQSQLSSIGTLTSSGSSSVTSIQSDTKTLLNTLVVPEDGLYYIRAFIRWNATSGADSGTRRIALLIDQANEPTYDLSAYENSNIEFPSSATGFVQQVANVQKLNKDAIIKFWAQQNSGVSTSVAYGNITIRKIG